MRAGPVLFGTIMAGVGLIAACRTPTQVTVDVTYHGPDACKVVPAIAMAVRLLPEDAESDVALHVYTAQTGTCDPDGQTGHFGTLVIVPADGEHRASIAIVGAVAPKVVTDCTAENHYAGCIVARRVITFTDHAKLELPISLDIECADVPCNALSTCKQKECVDTTTTCVDDKCGLPGEVPGTEAGPPVDVAAPDDASTRTGSDGSVTDAALDADADADADTGAPTCATHGKPLVCPNTGGAACATCCAYAAPNWSCSLCLQMPSNDGGQNPLPFQAPPPHNAGGTPNPEIETGFRCLGDDNCPTTAPYCCGNANGSICGGNPCADKGTDHLCDSACPCPSPQSCVANTNGTSFCKL